MFRDGLLFGTSEMDDGLVQEDEHNLGRSTAGSNPGAWRRP